MDKIHLEECFKGFYAVNFVLVDLWFDAYNEKLQQSNSVAISYVITINHFAAFVLPST